MDSLVQPTDMQSVIKSVIIDQSAVWWSVTLFLVESFLLAVVLMVDQWTGCLFDLHQKPLTSLENDTVIVVAFVWLDI